MSTLSKKFDKSYSTHGDRSKSINVVSHDRRHESHDISLLIDTSLQGIYKIPLFAITFDHCLTKTLIG